MADEKKPDRLQRLKRATQRVEEPLDRLVKQLNRLSGIVAKSPSDKDIKTAYHRLQTVVGYRKAVMRAGATLYALFATLQTVLDEEE